VQKVYCGRCKSKPSWWNWQPGDYALATVDWAVLLNREGFPANHKRVYRLYKQGNLALRRKSRKHLASATRVPLAEPTRANQECVMNFLHDTVADGRKFRTLNIVDVFKRECLSV
jgi:putative transposase